MSESHATPKLKTGIPRLDDVLHGGLPQGSIYLLGVGAVSLGRRCARIESGTSVALRLGMTQPYPRSPNEPLQPSQPSPPPAREPDPQPLPQPVPPEPLPPGQLQKPARDPATSPSGRSDAAAFARLERVRRMSLTRSSPPGPSSSARRARNGSQERSKEERCRPTRVAHSSPLDGSREAHLYGLVTRAKPFAKEIRLWER